MPLTKAAKVYALAGPEPQDRAIACWLLVVAGMILVMAMIGAATRLTESGLSIMEWALFSGILPPMGSEEWERIFALYRQIPEYAEENPGMSLSEFKEIFWWEYIHRLWGRLIGVVFLVGYVWFHWRREIRSDLVPQLLLMFLLGALQGGLGWYMVYSGFAARTDVSQYRLTVHLLVALLVYGYIFWVAVGLLRPAPRPSPDPRWRRLKAGLRLLAVLLFVTLASGGLMAGLNAGFTYNSFPLMDGNWLPPDYGEIEPFLLNISENISTVQFNHRLLAVLTLVAAFALWIWSRFITLAPEAEDAVALVALAALIQVALGIATLLMVVPLPLAVLHQAGGFLLLTAVLWALRRLPRSGA